MRRSPITGAVCILITLAGGCAKEFDSTRVEKTYGTIGAETFKVVCQRVASEEVPNDVTGLETLALCEGREDPTDATPPRLKALAENRERFVRAVDKVMPEAMKDNLEDFLLRLLPFYDDNRLPNSTRALSDFVGKLMADPDALHAMERIGQRQGYRPLKLALGLARPMMSYPRLDELLSTALSSIDEGGIAEDQWNEMQRISAMHMGAHDDDATSIVTSDSTLALTRRLLFSEDSTFASGTPRYLVRRDTRGMAIPILRDGITPFVDHDHDGLADIDGLNRFIDASGAELDIAAPFQLNSEHSIARDDFGRALWTDGTRIYSYMDVDRTMLAGVSREASQWLDATDPTLLNMAYGLPALLGPETTKTGQYDSAAFDYNTFDTSRGALFDLIYAVGQTLGKEETEDALTVVETMAKEHEQEVAGLIDSAWVGRRAGDEHPEAQLEMNSNMWDDIIQVAVWMSQEPGLTEAVLRALADPRSKRLGQVYAEMMRYRDRVDYDPSAFNAPRADVVFADPTDFSQPDYDDNQSIYQRSLSVIHDLDGVRMCNKDGAKLKLYVSGHVIFSWPPAGYDECELLQVDNVAQEYARSIIGRSHLQLKDHMIDRLLAFAEDLGLASADALLEQQSGIEGMTTRPTPYALDRLVFAPRNEFVQNLIDPPVSRDGVSIEARHHGTVFAWEREYRFDDGLEPSRVTFFGAMTPLLQAFDDYDRGTQGRFLFGELITALHSNWPSRYNGEGAMTQNADPNAAFYAAQSNARSYEPIIAKLFSDGQIFIRLHDFARALDQIQVRPGVDGIDVLARAGEALLDPDRSPGLTYRDGTALSYSNDGQKSFPVTPLYLILDALKKMDQAWEENPDRHELWLSARGHLADQLLSTTVDSGDAHLSNQRTVGLLLATIPFLRDRIEAHKAAGDLQEWSNTLASRAEESLGGPMASAIVRLMDALQGDPAAKEELAGLLNYMMTESNGEAFDTTLVAVADMLQTLDDSRDITPLVRGIANAMAPNVQEVLSGSETDLAIDGSALDRTLDLVRDIQGVDERKVLKEMMANMVALPEGDKESPIETIIDVITEINRATPNAGGHLTTQDYHEILDRTHNFLSDEDHGLERLYKVIQSRELNDDTSN